MLRVAIVGCGKIADQHVHAIRRVPDCRIVGLCDLEPLMARQLGERFGISACFSSVEDLLRASRPDVVHITTPPQSHYEVARECLEKGAHVYVEKPFTVTADEARSLIELVERYGLQITAGHNLQFTPEMLEARRLVRQGFLGAAPLQLESHFCYDLGDATYAKGLLGNPAHWIRRLPGGLFHNIISHGIAPLAEFLDDDLTDLVALADRSAQLKQLGEDDLQDELRVVIRDRKGATGFFCFSTQLKGLNQLRLCGPAGSIFVDHVSGTALRNRYQPCKSYLTYFVPPLRAARQHLRAARTNIANFITRKLYQDYGMKELIERFYASIRSGTEPPIPYREILLTARIMDEIFAQISAGTTQPARPATKVGRMTESAPAACR